MGSPCCRNSEPLGSRPEACEPQNERRCMCCDKNRSLDPALLFTRRIYKTIEFPLPIKTRRCIFQAFLFCISWCKSFAYSDFLWIHSDIVCIGEYNSPRFLHANATFQRENIVIRLQLMFYQKERLQVTYLGASTL